MQELKDTGYYSQIIVNTSKGFAYKYKLLAKPKVDKPHVDSPRVEKPHAVNQHSYKELFNKNDLNIEHFTRTLSRDGYIKL